MNTEAAFIQLTLYNNVYICDFQAKAVLDTASSLSSFHNIHPFNILWCKKHRQYMARYKHTAHQTHIYSMHQYPRYSIQQTMN